MNKKKTTEEFIEEAKEIHGDKYDYSKVNYINNRTKVCIVCSEHGEFWQTPGSHTNNGNGCPLCGNKNCSEKKLKSDNVFIKQAKEIHGEKYNYTKVKYRGNHKKVIIICPEHGEFLQSPDKHLQGCGCPKCNGGVKFTQEEFLKKAKEVHGDKYDYSKVEYINSHTNVCIICPKHGEFWQTPNSHLAGNGCSKCSGKAKSNTDEFIKKAQLRHGNKYDYSETIYTVASKKLKVICPIHGEFWLTANNHLRGKGCPKCAWSGVKLTTEEFINKAKLIHGNKYNYNKVEYVNSSTPVCITCPVHGEFLQTPNKHLCGCGCPKCILKSQTKLFEKLKEVLQEELVWEYTADWLEKQRIDIFIPKYNIGVEYNGQQHYNSIKAWGGEEGLKITKQRDSLKLEKCNNHGVNLLYLKYDYSEEEFNELVNTIKSIINKYNKSTY